MVALLRREESMKKLQLCMGAFVVIAVMVAMIGMLYFSLITDGIR